MTGVVSAADGGAIHADGGIFLQTGSNSSVDGTSVIESGLARRHASRILLTIDAGSLLQGAGAVSRLVDDGGQIIAYGGTLTLEGPVTGDGNLTVDASSELALDGAVAAGATIGFQRTAAMLALADVAGMAASISSFGVGDIIEAG